MKNWTQNFKDLLNLFLQSNCPLCQRPTSQDLCQNCNRQLQKCHLKDPTYLWKDPLPVFAWGAYGGILKRAIAAMKYENQPQIARSLGRSLGEAWLLHSPMSDKVVVVPIPLHPNKQKERGYNQAALIAESFCETTGLKLKQNGLARVRATEAQHSLSASKRAKNLAEAFDIGKDFRRCPEIPVLLVDDIYTTGATAMSAMQTLNQAGMKVVGLAATAHTLKG
ncbi:ComF family protein [Brasilonema sp. UFV-L1]|uniref:ComF family protein n=1 Tax=Brasilonema sp. UFV-L1 TaxID=2234130 RepID=UPI00145D2394|nr:ComF family protein [Brasilonema sp. UFV-L1]NMG07919.1 ComF family protein [Brasilonema sp. UFV-L1]